MALILQHHKSYRITAARSPEGHEYAYTSATALQPLPATYVPRHGLGRWAAGAWQSGPTQAR